MSKEESGTVKGARNLSPQELARYAGDIIAALPPGPGACVVALSGELGAGKTQFAKAVAASLGIAANVTSPTFLIMKSYPVTQGPFRRLYHLDCYRVGEAAEVRALGWDAIIADSQNLIVVEWAERIAELLPPSTLRLRLEISGENTRDIYIEE